MSAFARICMLVLCAAVHHAAIAAQVSSTRTDAGNTYVAGGEVTVVEPVGADLFAAGGRVRVEQSVAADAAVAGGSVGIRGEIGQDLRAAGGTVNIDGNVGGELVAAGGTVRLAKSSYVAGSALMAGGEVAMDGKIGKGAKIYAGKISVSGDIDGDASLQGQEIVLAPSARIVGNLVYASPNPLPQEQLARVSGRVMYEKTPANRTMRAAGKAMWFHPVFFVSMLICGSLLYLIFPNAVSGTQQTIRRQPLRSVAIGLALLFTIPPLALLFMLTLVGVPIGIGLFMLYPLLLLLGYLGAAFFIGREAADAMKQPEEVTFAKQLGFLAAALILLSLIAMIPFIGAFIVFVALVAGIGGWAIWLHKQYRRNGSSDVAVQAV